MRILVLGGTVFVGRHIVEAALACGYAVTIFHRGRNPASFSGPVAEVLGDRDSELTDLRHQTWDRAIDVSGYLPRLVRKSATALKGAVEHYTFISTVSVYADDGPSGRDESAPVAPAEYSTEDVSGHYGPLKVACEEVVREVYGDRAAIIRPCVIGGPLDPTDRLTFWPRRVTHASAGRFLAPGDPDAPVQVIDARDLAAWTLRMAAASRSGTYNATGPEPRLTMAGLVAAARQATSATAEPVWVSDEFLLAQGAKPFADIPLWLDRENWGFATISNAKALAAGLTCRPIADTLRDVWHWDRERGFPPLKAGISAEREAELLDRWAAGARQ